jgi:tetratricopeptide (TPR) repeat protein
MRVIAFALLLPLILPLIAVSAHAQIPNSTTAVQPTEAPTRRVSRINLKSSNAIRINYGQPRWNQSPQEIDTAIVILREASSGRVVQINLSETAPDSSIFSGLYSINWQNMEKLETEFYVPSQEMLAEKDGLLKVTQKIQAHELNRNPFILRRLPNGEQSIEIFDTKEQARIAMKAYRAEQLVMLENQKPTKFPSDQALDAERDAQLKRERENAARAASERARMEQVEAARLADLIAKQKALDAASRKLRVDKAAALAAEGLSFYKAEDFTTARGKFDDAVGLDPDNRYFYYQFGVTLYKTGDFNRALVFLNMTSDRNVNAVEKNYFIALTHLKLKEIDAALKSFGDVIASKDPVMGPSAMFYKGVIFFDQEKFDDAQAAFQSVLDSSNDTKLDERAEAYIEQILRARQTTHERDQKWSLSASIGEMYDSNVLLSSNSQRDAGTATNTAGWRTLLSGSARYRPVYDETHEFAAQVDAFTLYSFDQSFKFDQSLRNADPTVVSLTLPWTTKGVLFEKGHKLDIAPGYETTIMSIENSQTKVILSSPLLTVSNLLVMNDAWFNTISFEVRDDISKLDSSVGDDDISAIRFKLGTSNILFLNDKKDRILIPEGAISMNQAAGRNASYERLDLGVGYLLPVMKDTTANFKLAYYFLQFPQKVPAVRTDNSVTASVGFSKRLTDIWNAGILGSYNVNGSNEDANSYNKFTALLTLSAAYGL